MTATLIQRAARWPGLLACGAALASSAVSGWLAIFCNARNHVCTAATLVIIFAFAAVYVIGSVDESLQKEALSRPAPKSVSAVPHPPTQLHRGVVKRFSAKNGWGLITDVEVLNTSGNGVEYTKQMAQQRLADVRFYREDQVALGLGADDSVTFRVTSDTVAAGWLKAVNLQRFAPERVAGG